MGHKKLRAEASPSGPAPRERHGDPGVPPGGCVPAAGTWFSVTLTPQDLVRAGKKGRLRGLGKHPALAGGKL